MCEGLTLLCDAMLLLLQVKAVREEAARREAALQAQVDEARAAAAAAAAGGGGGEGGDLASLLAAREAELENLQAALGELSYEVRGDLTMMSGGSE